METKPQRSLTSSQALFAVLATPLRLMWRLMIFFKSQASRRPTLVRLILGVVVLVLVVVAVALPSNAQFYCYTQRSQAEETIQDYHRAQVEYFRTHQRYASTLAALNVSVSNSQQIYRYELAASGTEHFTLKAISDDSLCKCDTWSLDENLVRIDESQGCR